MQQNNSTETNREDEMKISLNGFKKIDMPSYSIMQMDSFKKELKNIIFSDKTSNNKTNTF
ncbi:MAG: hypothetical protein WCH10_03425 [bacterium]